MKKINKHILEAVNHGIKLALDDFDFDNNIESKPTNDIISIDRDYIEDRIRYNKLLSIVLEGYYNHIQPISKRVSDKFNGGVTKEIISELANLSKITGFKYKVNNKLTLQKLISFICKVDNTADLNWIDVSDLNDMSNLFRLNGAGNFDTSDFNGDISEWDVSNVRDMSYMFRGSSFNGDISKWNVSRVYNMYSMFQESHFNKPIKNWNVSRVVDMGYMFEYNTQFNQDISNWDVSNVSDFRCMFRDAHSFNQDVSNWDIEPHSRIVGMFTECNIKKKYMPAIVRDHGY